MARLKNTAAVMSETPEDTSQTDDTTQGTDTSTNTGTDTSTTPDTDGSASQGGSGSSGSSSSGGSDGSQGEDGSGSGSSNESGGETEVPGDDQTDEGETEMNTLVRYILGCFPKLETAYVDKYGGVYVSGTPESIRGDAVLYKNPFYHE